VRLHTQCGVLSSRHVGMFLIWILCGEHIMDTPEINFNDPTLFGNDAAEDEDLDVFNSYVVDRSETQEFTNPKNRIRIARAYKGEGKSALLRLARQKIPAEDVIVNATGPSLAPEVHGIDSDLWVNAWKRRILSAIASEVGVRIGMAWTDDAMSLVEEAEQNGFRERSLLSAILDRLTIKNMPVERKPTTTSASEQLIKRWLHDRTDTWIFIDDIDQNFQNTPEARAKIASIFTACRHITNTIPEIHFRMGVRPNIWTLVKLHFEALSHVEQYVIDLAWDESDLRRLLAERLAGYLRRQPEYRTYVANIPKSGGDRDERLIALAFEQSMPWGRTAQGKSKTRPPHVVLSTLSRHRPRWLIELCKEAARTVRTTGKNRIALEDIVSQLPSFGKRRINDTVAEFRAQCPQVHELITAFHDQREDYRTSELFDAIKRRVLPALHVTIEGVSNQADARQIAAFLFQIGFLTARQDLPDGDYRHFSFAQKPDLLLSRTNIDQGMSWEIHPVFRQALGLRTVEGREVRKRDYGPR